MISESRPIEYDRALRYPSIERRADELVGSRRRGNVLKLNNFVRRLQSSPDTNEGLVIELEFLDDFDLSNYSGQDLTLEKGYRMEVNARVLDRLYERFGVVDSKFSLDMEQDSNELWISTEHISNQGFIFKEVIGYAPYHLGEDFTPDTICVTAEAIRVPDSDHMNWN